MLDNLNAENSVPEEISLWIERKRVPVLVLLLLLLLLGGRKC